jgi:hypothetical protein
VRTVFNVLLVVMFLAVSWFALYVVVKLYREEPDGSRVVARDTRRKRGKVSGKVKRTGPDAAPR